MYFYHLSANVYNSLSAYDDLKLFWQHSCNILDVFV